MALADYDLDEIKKRIYEAYQKEDPIMEELFLPISLNLYGHTLSMQCHLYHQMVVTIAFFLILQ